ncbi:MAG: hypothetical protein Q8R22_14615 [Flavobacterium sp.]|uniref:hypothetical protein n=1 Tax=Flavobacterium sp. TaxID=239 RepID=UPI0027341A32|nr:hypothetical protein [Flavobacterium sp.]MDP3682060.1 hypothetical protein [Flavobacterium sp.]MDZ4330427.1 hypothetical protein [Flavobacterium sp.]
MKKALILSILILQITGVFAQKFTWDKHEFEAVNTKAEIVNMDGVQVLKVERDLIAFPFDEKNIDTSTDGPTYVKLTNVAMENGTIEVKMLSRIMENSPFPAARGFIGVAYRVDQENKNFDAIYLRPSNGRADDQLRRNHTVQYFSYPENTFSRLRKEANGLYETYADIGLNEWIDVRIEFQDEKAVLYINNQKSPSFIVTKMLGTSKTGSIALWVEIGTVGYFKDLKVTKK